MMYECKVTTTDTLHAHSLTHTTPLPPAFLILTHTHTHRTHPSDERAFLLPPLAGQGVTAAGAGPVPAWGVDPCQSWVALRSVHEDRVAHVCRAFFGQGVTQAVLSKYSYKDGDEILGDVTVKVDGSRCVTACLLTGVVRRARSTHGWTPSILNRALQVANVGDNDRRQRGNEGCQACRSCNLGVRPWWRWLSL